MTNIISEVDKLGARRGADVLLEILYSEGVEYIFGNPGTTELPLMDALLRAPQLNYILALQEATAVAMADGYAQAARRPAFLNLHTAGGLGHGMGSLLNANVSQTPLVVTAGQQDSRHTVTDPLLFGGLRAFPSRHLTRSGLETSQPRHGGSQKSYPDTTQCLPWAESR